jgi:ABC-2 type transport system permease protein
MIRILAMTRANWQVMSSYRIQFLMSMAGLVVSIVPLYFIAQAVQPVMARSISDQGGGAFGFLVVGIATFTLVSVCVTALPGAVGGGIGNGMFEALVATPTSTPILILGMNAFDVSLAALRCAVLLVTGWLLGARFAPGHLLPGIAILGLLVLAHLPFGYIGAALVIAFRTAGPLPKAIMLMSGLLGGVYYPTTVIPSWLRSVSEYLPMSHGLRALRRVVLQEAPLSAVAPDLLALAGAALFLHAVGAVAVNRALRYARHRGTLAQY